MKNLEYLEYWQNIHLSNVLDIIYLKLNKKRKGNRL